VRKEHAIIFNGLSVRAILEGRKTQTRRVMNPQPYNLEGMAVLWKGRPVDIEGCPYGKVGDRLWVKETWRIDGWDPEYGIRRIQYRADGTLREPEGYWPDTGNEIKDQDAWERYWLQCAEDAQKVLGDPTMEHGWDGDPGWEWEPGDGPCRWRGGRYMPRWASRITLEITGIRVQRLQDISFEDCVAEGCDKAWKGFDPNCPVPGCTGWHYGEKYHFQTLWDKINAKREFGWYRNPWVWALEFRVV